MPTRRSKYTYGQRVFVARAEDQYPEVRPGERAHVYGSHQHNYDVSRCSTGFRTYTSHWQAPPSLRPDHTVISFNVGVVNNCRDFWQCRASSTMRAVWYPCEETSGSKGTWVWGSKRDWRPWPVAVGSQHVTEAQTEVRHVTMTESVWRSWSSILRFTFRQPLHDPGL